MNYADWYTDTVTIFRVTPVKKGNLTTQKRTEIAADIPCRIYRENDHGISMQRTAAKVDQTQKLAADNDVDIKAGDELLITRGGVLGKSREVIRAFAGEPNYYYEPFGAVIPGLAHQEVTLLQEERAK